ncbi:MAG: hypothetical protein ACRD8W_00080 [Nitrososphaeraceae archaeon]
MVANTSASDKLHLTNLVKEYGISEITRHSSTMKGFVIHVLIKNKPLIFAVGNSWKSALANLKKACERFHASHDNANNNNKTDVRELQCILESTLVQNASWVMGYDLRAAESGFTIKSDSYSIGYISTY